MACAVVVPNCEPWGRSPSPDTRWFALYTHPNAEGKVCHGLSRLGIEHYLPTCKVLTRWTAFRHRLDTPIEVSRPLFPGYVFARFDLRNGLRPMLQVSGVGCVVSYGDDPAELSERDIDTIRILEASGLPLEDCPLAVGQKVLVECGPLAGAYGKVEQIDDATYLVISLSIFGRSKRVKVDRDWLEAA